VLRGWNLVPLIIAGPGVSEKGKVSEQPAVSMDFFTTILSIAGVQHEKNDGENLLPVLVENKRLNRDELFWHFPHYHGSGWKPGSACEKATGNWWCITRKTKPNFLTWPKTPEKQPI
jgi:arylsulfatase A-like enzyme